MIALGQTHPVLPLILEYRKARSTLQFVGKLLESARKGSAVAAGAGTAALAAAEGPGSGPRIRQPLLQTNSDTGRLAMDDPSLQVRWQTEVQTWQHIMQPVWWDKQLAPQSPHPHPHPHPVQCVPNAHELLLRTSDPASGLEVPPSGVAAEACPRKGFVAPPGCVLLSADWKQMELRLMAHFRSAREKGWPPALLG